MQVIADIGPRGADRSRIGAAAALLRRHEAFVDALGQEIVGHFLVEPRVEPVKQTAHFGAPARGIGHQPAAAKFGAACLVEIFEDRTRPADRGALPVKQHRQGAGRIDDQEFTPALPGAFLDEFGAQAVLPERNPNAARKGAEWVMIETEHT